MAKADAQTIMAADLVIERADIVELIDEATAPASTTPVSSRRPIWPGSQGWPCAPRPTITASAPDISSADHGFFE